MYNTAKDVLRGKRVSLLNISIQNHNSDIQYDMIVSHMCLQVVNDLNGVLQSIAAHMDDKTIFVFAIPHPCFYNNYKQFFNADEYRYMEEMSKVISFTITQDPANRISGIPYHHRPLSKYFSCIKRQHLFIDEFDEIYPDNDVQEQYGQAWLFPRYCVFKVMRKG